MVEWTAMLVFKFTRDDHDHIDQHPDAEATKGEKLDEPTDDMTCIKAMDPEIAEKMAEKNRCEPVFLRL
jgi:hypothetical protein